MNRWTVTFLMLVVASSCHGGPWRTVVPLTGSSFTSSLDVMTETMEMTPSSREMMAELTCTINGKFPIPDSCEEFYQCDDWDDLGMKMYHFICPSGTIFDDRLLSCNDPSLVTTRPSCSVAPFTGNEDEDAAHIEYRKSSTDIAFGKDNSVIELTSGATLVRHRRFILREETLNMTQEVYNTTGTAYDINIEEGNMTYQCSGDISESNTKEESNITDSEVVSRAALGSCRHIYNVDKYVEVVRSMIPVIYPDSMKRTFNVTVVDDYNRNLENAQNHTYVWRQGDDIMSGLRRTYELAKLFGPEFQRKYDVAESRMNMLKQSDSIKKDELDLREDIQFTTDMINDYKELITSNPTERRIASYQPKIDKLQVQLQEKKSKLKEFLTADNELEELIFFLEFVKTDANKIKSRADATVAKLKTFKEQTSQDRNSFVQSRGAAKHAIDESIRETERTMDEISRYMEDKHKLEDERQEYKDDVRRAEAAIDSAVIDMRASLESYRLKQEEASETRALGAGLSYIPILGSFIGGGMMDSADASVSHLPDLMEKQDQHYETVVNIEENKILRKSKQIDQSARYLFDLQDKIFDSQSNLKNLGFVEMYMTVVIDQANMILSYIDKAIASLGKVEYTFENIIFNLASLIANAKEIEEPAQRRDFTSLFYKDMSKMLTNWNNSYSDIIDIGRCTQMDYYESLVEEIEALELLLSSNSSVSEVNCTIATEPPINNTSGINELPFDDLFPIYNTIDYASPPESDIYDYDIFK